ncbi:MAG: amidohydrolase family protein [Acidobacteria bacterium]|nr:amidohydrolase family protein [Acidobacteriota bacterium]
MRIFFIFLCAAICGLWTGRGAENAQISPADLERIDAHAHVFNPSPAIYRMFDRLNLRIVNICVVDKYDPGFEEADPQHKAAREVFHGTRGRAAWCSTFDPQDWESPGFAQRVIARLDKTFEDGALAVKIYKSMGMELKSKSGEYLMPDNAVFDPIYAALAARGKTLYAHLAEPSAAWRPLDPSSPHYGYYKNNPDWHMYRHPERPSKEAILAARDRILEHHPKLRVVGCHLGSMEEDVDDIAERFERYPNFAVDTAARVPDLMLQPRDKVRAFLTKYQDRVLYATDLVALPGEDADQAVKRWEEEYARDWTYFATDGTVEYLGRTIRGLALPEPVLRKFYHWNALHWVPGIMGSK